MKHQWIVDVVVILLAVVYTVLRDWQVSVRRIASFTNAKHSLEARHTDCSFDVWRLDCLRYYKRVLSGLCCHWCMALDCLTVDVTTHSIAICNCTFPWRWRIYRAVARWYWFGRMARDESRCHKLDSEFEQALRVLGQEKASDSADAMKYAIDGYMAAKKEDTHGTN